MLRVGLTALMVSSCCSQALAQDSAKDLATGPFGFRQGMTVAQLERVVGKLKKGKRRSVTRRSDVAAHAGSSSRVVGGAGSGGALPRGR